MNARRGRITALAAAALIVLSACGGNSGPDAPGTSAPSVAPGQSAWDQALGAVDNDGHYTTDAALTLFAVAFGDMPGVAKPTGPVGPIRSATIALRAVLAHEDELTEAQRARVAEVRAIPDGSAGTAVSVAFHSPSRMVAVASPVPSVGPDERHLLMAKASQLRQDIAARLGGDIPGELNLVFDPRNEAVPGTSILKSGMADALYTGGKYSGCNLHLYPSTFTGGSDPVTTTAHEMIHCFQGAIYPDEHSYLYAPQWALEGSAEWASASLVGPDQLDTQLWQAYLTETSVPLFRKTYEAIGFYAHLAETGHSPWAAFRSMWTTKGNLAQYTALGATSPDFLDSWASSTSRHAAFGDAWDTTGPGITQDSAPQVPLVVGDGTTVKVAAPAYTEIIYALAADTDLIDVSITGHGRLSDGRIDETSLGSKTFCLRPDQCTCPDGSVPENATALEGSGALLALTGGPGKASGTVRGRNLDCKGTGAAGWHFDSPSKYSGGPSHTVVDAYTCTGLHGPWHGVLHVTHTPATTADPPLDRTVEFSWTFGRDQLAVPVIGPYSDTVFGTTHSLVYYPVIRLDETKRTITVVSMKGSEDGSPRIDVTYQLGRVGVPVPLTDGKPSKC